VLACREHVVDDDEQLREFLDAHPVNRLAGGENAYPLRSYVDAVRESGLVMDRVLGPWDSVINAYPGVRTQGELDALLEAKLTRRIGPAGHLAIHFPGVKAVIRRRIDKHEPGRMYSLLAHRPK
jgi:hypothetical protein